MPSGRNPLVALIQTEVSMYDGGLVPSAHRVLAHFNLMSTTYDQDGPSAVFGK